MTSSTSADAVGAKTMTFPPPSAFLIPTIGGDVSGNVGGRGNINNSSTNGTNLNKSVRRRRKMYSESTYR